MRLYLFAVAVCILVLPGCELVESFVSSTQGEPVPPGSGTAAQVVHTVTQGFLETQWGYIATVVGTLLSLFIAKKTKQIRTTLKEAKANG